MYKKRPSKQALYERIEALEKENRAIAELADKERKERWTRNIPAAMMRFGDVMRTRFGTLFSSPVFEHVDAAGYWFTFELTNDARRQTYCIRHEEVQNA